MPYFSTYKIPKNSAAVTKISGYLNPCGYGKITHLTIFASSDPSSSCFSLNSCSKTSRPSSAERSLKRGKACHGESKTEVNECSKAPTTIMANKISSPRRQRFWRKLLFGSKKLRSIILLNVVAAVYASNFAVVKEAETYMDPAAFSAVRFVVSAIPFLPFMLEARNDVQIRKAGMELGLWISLGYLMEALGLLTAEAGRASVISLFTVIVVPLLESMLGTIVPARTWFGVLMSVLGIAMLECSGSPPNVGDLLNFLSAIFFGIHTLRTAHISRSTRKENFLALLGYEVCVVAVLSTIWCLIGGTSEAIQGTETVPRTWPIVWDSVVAFPWIPALYTGVFSTGLCLWAEIAAMREVSATETALIYGLEPIWGAGFAWFLLGERWGTAGWIGALLILGGSLTVQMYESSSNESRDIEKTAKKQSLLTVSDNQKQGKKLAASPAVVSSKNVTDMLKE